MKKAIEKFLRTHPPIRFAVDVVDVYFSKRVGRAAAELAETAQTVRRRLSFPEGEAVKVSYSGGLFRAGEVILDPFQAEMDRLGFTLVSPAYSPIVGALALAAEKYVTREELDKLLETVSKQL